MFNQNIPLAERMRPKSLSEYLGQEHLLGEKGVIKKAIDSQAIPSMILWGPPGVGKTTLATIIANTVKLPFHSLSAISSGVKEVREIIQKARLSGRIILFIDEIHRFNKAQQDALLGAVEAGTITLIGATTENPSFEVISALLSRCQVYILNSLSAKQLEILLQKALENDDWLIEKSPIIKEKDALLRLSNGDARKLLNLLEISIKYVDRANAEIDNEIVFQAAQQRELRYDKGGEMHYDVISAFIKSIRGSDPQAAVYWLARMLEGGEDIKFIARRLVILASEDIGLANPTALVLANATFDSIHKIGMPEARIILSECAIYLAGSPKSNSAYVAIDAAISEVRKSGDLPVPLHLRNAPTKLMKNLNYGKDYKYSHSYEDHFVKQQYLPSEIEMNQFYIPGENPRENEIRTRLKKFWDKRN